MNLLYLETNEDKLIMDDEHLKIMIQYGPIN